MTREQLVRAHFEAFSNLEWAKYLEPKFRLCGFGEDEMLRYRDDWNAYTKKRDWKWWQNHTKTCSDEKLRAEIVECRAAIKALGTPAQASDRASHQAFKRILGSDTVQPDAEPAPTPVKTRER
jgi:hypothetical protein